MTLQQYLNQQNVCKQFRWSVLINDDNDVTIWYQHTRYAGKEVILFSVEIKILNTVYLCYSDGYLYTQDDQGNIKTPSVFKITPKILTNYVRNTIVPYS